ncbi:endolytic transglycosylase MltG [Caldisalinibacter kiritimatiensis]|uniref:Aminodeoxychorismate lyase n=1 Tax=Caldisalinibacter kiritimatiensis TaxID=1304284 RepID=R1CXM0_9FIRM|nr:endolytic transglycosylase MltG [Caldisalinibacter kiritimatiensis]EOD01359.1 hypothetical protein L21TH_0580 [Caldisalinibacter kiritimatiensis]
MRGRAKLLIITLILGFGLGMITTSIINLLYPTVKYKQYTEEEIKEMAKELGMVEIKDVKTLYKNQNDSEKDEKESKNLNKNKATDEKAKEEENKQYIVFRIEKGEVSEGIIERLYSNNIIKDKEEFNRLVIEKNAEKRFIYGVYKLKKNMDCEEVLDILCGF